jgi:SNF family Na+-dependent transporter
MTWVGVSRKKSWMSPAKETLMNETAINVPTRERWGTKIGLILAMAGNAIGLGNFLRFPVQAAQNGGGAFMIPYFVALVLLGIPLMWVEWGIGRHGGKFGYGSVPGMFDTLWKNKLAKYLGVVGLIIPLIILVYYTYVESWTLAFSFFSATCQFEGATTREAMGNFVTSYQGITTSVYFDGYTWAYIFFLITFGLNFFVLYKGIAKGIEILAKIAMPLLFIFAIILVIRVFTLGTPDPVNYPDRNVINGLAFVWNPDFSQLSKAGIWLAAAGQIFFTLSLGLGSIQCYASYLKEKDDIALTGLTTASTNEFAEVVLGGSIAIPVAVAFFGLAEMQDIARSGSFNLGFQAMPVIFQKIPIGEFFGALWFGLLFFAGITSSVAMGQPVIAFLEEEFKLTRQKAVIFLVIVAFIAVQPVIFFLQFGFLDEMNYWGGTFGLAVFALIEVILFAWVFGMDNAWEEINKGSDMEIPKIFYYIIKYVTPLYLIFIFIAWTYQDAIDILFLNKDPNGNPVVTENKPYILGARAMMLFFALSFLIMIWYAWKKKKSTK